MRSCKHGRRTGMASRATRRTSGTVPAGRFQPTPTPVPPLLDQRSAGSGEWPVRCHRAGPSTLDHLSGRPGGGPANGIAGSTRAQYTDSDPPRSGPTRIRPRRGRGAPRPPSYIGPSACPGPRRAAGRGMVGSGPAEGGARRCGVPDNGDARGPSESSWRAVRVEPRAVRVDQVHPVPAGHPIRGRKVPRTTRTSGAGARPAAPRPRGGRTHLLAGGG